MERERGNPSANQPNTDQPSRDLEGRLPSPLPQEIGEFLARAGRAKEKGDLEGARAAYERAIALSPGLAEARYHLASSRWPETTRTERQKAFGPLSRASPTTSRPA